MKVTIVPRHRVMMAANLSTKAFLAIRMTDVRPEGLTTHLYHTTNACLSLLRSGPLSKFDCHSGSME